MLINTVEAAVVQCPNVKVLRVVQCPRLIVRNCPQLKTVLAQGALLEFIEVSDCPALETLNVSNNYLSELRVPSGLRYLNCSINLLEELDARDCPVVVAHTNALERLVLRANRMQLLNVRYNNLEWFEFGGQIDHLDVRSNHLNRFAIGGARSCKLAHNPLGKLGAIPGIVRLDIACTNLERVAIASHTLEKLVVDGSRRLALHAPRLQKLHTSSLVELLVLNACNPSKVSGNYLTVLSPRPLNAYCYNQVLWAQVRALVLMYEFLGESSRQWMSEGLQKLLWPIGQR